MGHGDGSDDEREAQIERSRAAVRLADWSDPTLLAELLRYGIWRLRSLPGREARQQRAKELMSEALTRIMEGRRVWRQAGEVPLAAFVKGVMRSIANEWLEEHFSPADEDFVACLDADEVPPDVEDETTPDPRLGGIEAAVAGDADLESYYLAVLDGPLKREQLAASLGWSTEKVSVVRKKLRRRLETAAHQKGGET